MEITKHPASSAGCLWVGALGSELPVLTPTGIVPLSSSEAAGVVETTSPWGGGCLSAG